VKKENYVSATKFSRRHSVFAPGIGKIPIIKTLVRFQTQGKWCRLKELSEVSPAFVLVFFFNIFD
jgi:hypothetical protein